MIHSTLVMTNILNNVYHNYAEQITGRSPTKVLQAGRKPRSEILYPLAYLKATLSDETHALKDYLALVSFGFISFGDEFDIAEISGFPHGLRTLLIPSKQRGFAGLFTTGYGDQWARVLQFRDAPVSVLEWQKSCLTEFNRHNISEYFK